MTAAEWLTATDPFKLVELGGSQLNDRKLRLFCCACCFRYATRVHDTSTHAATVTLERYADGLVSETERLYPNTLLYNSLICEMWDENAYRAAVRAASGITADIGKLFRFASEKEQAIRLELEVQSALFRDIFGNPFCPVTLNPSWLTSTVVSLANGIYAEKAFDRMPILADALQDAECDNEDILNHCRQPGEHVRGCFVVDSLLGKS
jgi:hypothetical protein